MKIAIISSNKWKDKCRGDRQLHVALLDRGIISEIVSWQENIDWQSFDLLILRSPWDYYEMYDDFCLWLEYLKVNRVKIANGAENIINNTNKDSQFQLLSGSGIPLIPYYICDIVSDAFRWVSENSYEKIVVKPSVSASGYNTYLIKNLDNLKEKFNMILQDGHKVIIQPYISNVSSGEISLVYFHGDFSHAILRYPGVIGQKKEAVPMSLIGEDWLEVGNRICKYLKAERLLYIRIDLVKYYDIISVMEIEIAEPDLYLDLDYAGKNTMEKFVTEIVKEANSSMY